nr:Transposase, Ptta/En/Spm, plant [Ipomoea batatas]
MDKAWMTQNKRSNEYIEGLKEFMIFVVKNKGHDCEIRCYVLASQAKQVFYLNDPKLGLNWQVVQQFQHRHIYDENEVGSIPDDKDDTHDNNDVYQDNEMVSSNGITIGLSDDISTSLHRVDVESHIVEAIIVPSVSMRLDIVNFREDPRVFQCVENILKVRYRNYKHALHKEFLKYHSATEAKLHVPKGLTTENWNELCDYWSKGDVQVKCMINSWCRSQQKMPHNQGSAAFVPVFNELRQKEEGCFMPNGIALFKFTRCKNDKWITNEAEENYKKMVAMLETSELEGNPMTADQVYDAVMGKRSGYVKGMGNGPKPVTSTSTRANNSHLEEKMKATMERKHSTKE